MYKVKTIYHLSLRQSIKYELLKNMELLGKNETFFLITKYSARFYNIYIDNRFSEL